MARRNISFLPNQYYHIYNRGAHKLEIFRAASDYRFLLQLIKNRAEKYDISVIAYCLMPNHYHFLFRQNSDTTISSFIQAVFNLYSKAFNRKYCHSGTLFERSFQAILVNQTEYLLHLCRYIHRNPLDAGMVKHPAEWEFSNYLEWVKKRTGKLVDMEFVRDNFGNSEEYEDFVLSYVPLDKTEKVLRHYLFP
jgi:REP element-mobilizing transposase RayT